MELTKKAISDFKTIIPGIDGYSVLLAKIENNISINPDISIEACKSLIEGLCLKALSLLSHKYNSNKSFRTKCKNDLKTLTVTAFDEVYSNYVESQIHESLSNMVLDISVAKKYKEKAKRKIKEQTVETVGKISAIRNERGDISHGRNYPKSQESSTNLAKSIDSITDGICSFMISEIGIQYAQKRKDRDKLDFAELEEFNIWLNDQHSVLSIKVDYSSLLYENAYDKYEEYYYTEFLDAEEVESNETDEIENPEERKDDKVETEEPPAIIEKDKPKEVEKLINKFDETTFWNQRRNALVHIFSVAENTNEDGLKKVVEDYLFSEKDPMRDDVRNIMNIKPSLKESATVIPDLTKIIIELANDLSKPEE